LSSVSETIVREFFEQHGFFVSQPRKHIALARREQDQIDLFVLNPRWRPGAELPFVLTASDLTAITRAVVVVKGWHTETFSPARLAHAQEIFESLGATAFRHASRAFGDGGDAAKILVIPGLPASAEARQQSIELLRAKGINAVIPFRVILADLISQVEVNRNYQKSDLLQTIRILKNYGLLKEPQLELFKSKARRGRKPGR
jgi:hypothetical protein